MINDTNLYDVSISGAIQTLADTRFHTLDGNIENAANTTEINAPLIPSGTFLYGSFTAIKLHGGRVVAYKK